MLKHKRSYTVFAYWTGRRPTQHNTEEKWQQHMITAHQRPLSKAE